MPLRVSIGRSAPIAISFTWVSAIFSSALRLAGFATFGRRSQHRRQLLSEFHVQFLQNAGGSSADVQFFDLFFAEFPDRFQLLDCCL